MCRQNGCFVVFNYRVHSFSNSYMQLEESSLPVNALHDLRELMYKVPG